MTSTEFGDNGDKRHEEAREGRPGPVPDGGSVTSQPRSPGTRLSPRPAHTCGGVPGFVPGLSRPPRAALRARRRRRFKPLPAPLPTNGSAALCRPPHAPHVSRSLIGCRAPGAPALHGRAPPAAPPRPGRAGTSGAAIGRARSVPPIGCGQRSAGQGRWGEAGEERPRRGCRRNRERSEQRERRSRPIRASADGPAPLPASAARPAPANHGRSPLRANGLGRTSERVYILRRPMASAPREPPANGRSAASDSWPMGAADSPVPRRGGWGSPRRRLRNVNYSTWRRRLPGSRPWWGRAAAALRGGRAAGRRRRRLRRARGRRGREGGKGREKSGGAGAARRKSGRSAAPAFPHPGLERGPRRPRRGARPAASGSGGFGRAGPFRRPPPRGGACAAPFTPRRGAGRGHSRAPGGKGGRRWARSLRAWRGGTRPLRAAPWPCGGRGERSPGLVHVLPAGGEGGAHLGRTILEARGGEAGWADPLARGERGDGPVGPPFLSPKFPRFFQLFAAFQGSEATPEARRGCPLCNCRVSACPTPGKVKKRQKFSSQKRAVLCFPSVERRWEAVSNQPSSSCHPSTLNLASI